MSVRYSYRKCSGLSGTVRIPNKYSIVLTTAQVELHWKRPVFYIVNFE